MLAAAGRRKTQWSLFDRNNDQPICRRLVSRMPCLSNLPLLPVVRSCKTVGHTGQLQTVNGRLQYPCSVLCSNQWHEKKCYSE